MPLATEYARWGRTNRGRSDVTKTSQLSSAHLALSVPIATELRAVDRFGVRLVVGANSSVDYGFFAGEWQWPQSAGVWYGEQEMGG